MIMKMRLWMVVGMALLGILAVVGEVRAKHFGLNGKGDFAEIARQGFFETMHNNGTFLPTNPATDATASALPGPPPGYNTYLNRQRNSYTWGSGWFNGKYYVGTVRDVGCFLVDPDDPLCPHTDANGDGIPEPGADQRAEIWAYTPAGTGGATGSWTRVLQSPCIVAGGSFFISACQGFPTLGVAANLPRDIGYRGMTVGAVGPLDTTTRLWIGTFGIGGRVLHSTNGTTFSVASTNGLATIPSITTLTGLTNLQNVVNVDLGYRSILIWNGRLWIAPAGSYLDEDLPVNPVVLANSNPASTSSTWQTIVNVKTHPTLGDPDNLGIFQMGVFNGDLYIGVTNRTTGVQVWRLPSSQCPPPTSSGSTCPAPTLANPRWERVITAGGGRLLDSDGLPSSAGVSDMKVYNGGSGDALYVATSESAAFNQSASELFRINADGSWDLIMGRPRVKSQMDLMNADPALSADFNCVTPNVNSGTTFAFGAPTGTVPACFPRSNMGAGFGGGANGFSNGRASYIWRMVVHDDGSGTGPYLYGGTLDLSSSSSNPPGFDLLRSQDGVNWSTTAGNPLTVNLDGLGNAANYGVRTLVSVPDWPNSGPGGVGTGPALLVGTANPFTGNSLARFYGTTDDDLFSLLGYTPTGGAEVHLGTCAPASTPVAVASANTKSGAPGRVIFDGTRYIAFDDESAPDAGDSWVDVTLVGSGSYDTFCGDLTAYEWSQIDGLGGIVIGGPLALGALTPPAAVPNLPLTTLGTGPDHTDYFYRLCVTDETPQTACADVNVRAEHNLPPTALIQAAPEVPQFTGGNNRVTLIDVDGNGTETLPVRGKCSDPENALASTAPTCTWTAEEEVTVAGGFPFEDANPADFTTSYNVTAPVTNFGQSDLYLTATDDHGYTGQITAQVRVRAATHDVQVTNVAQQVVGSATVNVAQNVNVTVRNNGHFSETFNVALSDTTGGSVSSPQSVTLDACVDTTTYPGWAVPSPSACPSQVLTFSWTPTAPAGQPHTLTATAATVGGETNTANNSLSVSVAMVNQPPTATPQDKTTNEDTSVGITLTGNDPDNDSLTFQVVTGPSHGSLSGTAPNLTYTPTSNYHGSDSFTFTVNDGTATSAPATVDITVNPVNDAPSFTKGANQTVAAAAGAQTVVGWATNISAGPSDESGQALDFLVSNNNNGLFTVQPAIASNGTLTYTPLSTAPTGVATVTVRIHDNGGTSPGVDTSAAQTFTITVNGVSTFNAPTGVTATLTGVTRQVNLVWTDNATTETSYQVQRCRLTFGFCSYSTVSGSPFAANTTSINNTVSFAGTYRFRARACNGSTCTAYVTSNNIAVP
jgi:hypothetical protein